MPRAIVDTGPIIALLDRSQRHHRWVCERIGELDPPLLVCEPVLAEASYLLARYPVGCAAMFDLLENGSLRPAFHIDEHIPELRRRLQKYRDIPMSLADACIVSMAEIYDRYSVLTLDSDFFAYRKHDRRALTIIHPSN